jgi:hypothetical protein
MWCKIYHALRGWAIDFLKRLFVEGISIFSMFYFLIGYLNLNLEKS